MAKRPTKQKQQLEDLTEALIKNGAAIKEEAGRKWSSLDLKDIVAVNTPQQQLFEAFAEGKHIVANGSAGTGKTFISLYLALNEILKKGRKYNKIIIVRSAVPSREIGHLPGDLNEKIQVYEMPYIDIVNDLLSKWDAYEDLKKKAMIAFMPTSFVRGLTWDNSIVIVDEIQNMTFHEIDSIMTRCGQNTRIVAIGDYTQSDLTNKRNETSGIKKFLDVTRRMGDFYEITFTRHDIVRSNFVKQWICAKEDVEQGER